MAFGLTTFLVFKVFTLVARVLLSMWSKPKGLKTKSIIYSEVYGIILAVLSVLSLRKVLAQMSSELSSIIVSMSNINGDACISKHD